MRPRTSVGQRGLGAALRIGLINNMPDAALQSTEAQFFGPSGRRLAARHCAAVLLSRAKPQAVPTPRRRSAPLAPRGAPGRAPGRFHHHRHRAEGGAPYR